MLSAIRLPYSRGGQGKPFCDNFRRENDFGGKEAAMAKKNRTVFVCQECGYESPKWMGQCVCGAWNSMVEEKVVDIDADDKRRRTGSRNEKGGAVQAVQALRSGIGRQKEDRYRYRRA